MKSVLSGKPVAQFILFVVSLLISISGYETWLSGRRFGDTGWEREYLMPILMTILPGITATVTMVYLMIIKRFRAVSITLSSVVLLMAVADTIANKANHGIYMRTPQRGKFDMTEVKSEGAEILETFVGQKYRWVVLGKRQPGKLTRYSAHFCSYNLEMRKYMSDYIPNCFKDYATSILRYDNETDQYYYLLTTYLTWKYPGFRIGLVCVNPEDGEIVTWANVFLFNVSHTTYPTHMQVISPKPLIRELLAEPERLVQRFYTYWNIIRYTFWSPFTRTDLMHDPIFRVRTLTLDEIDDLDLPEKRKEVLRRCVRERVERERERAVKAAAEADSMVVDDRGGAVEL